MSLEKRQWQRLEEHSTVFIETLCAGEQTLQPTEIVICSSVEVSTTGVRVCVDDALQTGSILQLGVQLHGAEQPLYLVGEVRWCAADPQRSGSYTVGFELIESDGTDYLAWCNMVSSVH
ncbi:PilZ domain-containing protein [Halieaceae bacterium IMCC14734]|uniref:PilZ domain-containing protein n=1 Tax=Candidatus Litorirhabdus singularis TaxID=2518993 RepID=A0ABT3TDG5_9GAMM|nr:PilZ domain-containing protein [Candidatus Litorirhabdus singularis]MCX2979502.1 PilZ domain-containing protein [Candidatus Litorirhabdus singularis]